MTDARFEDAAFADRPLQIGMIDADDLAVVSALVQDAVGQVADITWMKRRRRLVLLLNRFRWEDREAAERQGRPFERVRTALIFESVMSVRSSGLTPGDRDTVYAILRLSFTPGEDGTGQLTIDLAGDGALALDVECIDGRIVDLTRPWTAKSSAAPDHDPV